MNLIRFILFTALTLPLSAQFTFRDVGVAAFNRAAAASSLVSSNNLQCYLKLDSNLNDSFGTAWTDNGGVAYTGGVIGQQVIIVREDNSDPCNPIPAENISHASDTRFNITENWTIGFHVAISDNTLDSYIVNKQVGATEGYFMVFQANNYFQFYLADDIDGLVWTSATTFGLPANNATNFVVARRTGSTVEISVNGGAWDGITLNGEPITSTEPIYIGTDAAGTDMGGKVDEFFIYQRALTDDEIDKLGGFGSYAGQGPTRPQLP